MARFIPTCVGNSRMSRCLPEYLPVHPHVCGELTGPRSRGCCPGGSSPRVWGTREINRKRGFFCRFIPTCVGNSVGVYLLVSLFPVHPHVCGELISRVRGSRSWFGSSPRVWGTLFMFYMKTRKPTSKSGSAAIFYMRRLDNNKNNTSSSPKEDLQNLPDN